MKRKDHSGRSSDNQLAKELSRAKQSTFSTLKKYSNLYRQYKNSKEQYKMSFAQYKRKFSKQNFINDLKKIGLSGQELKSLMKSTKKKKKLFSKTEKLSFKETKQNTKKIL